MRSAQGQLPHLPLGTTRASISRVGLGTWAMGGGSWDMGWGGQDERDSLEAIVRAAEQGVNWVDTAPAYGLGRSEAVVGRALGQLGADERPYVFTKCGLVWDDGDRMPRPDVRPASIRRECHASLRRLGVERLDLLQIHWPAADAEQTAEAWGTVVELADSGKVRWVGASNFDVDDLRACESVRHVDAAQAPFSLIERDAAALLPWSVQHATAVLAYSPLQSGLLSGRFDRRCLAPGDWRRRTDAQFPNQRNFQEPQLGRNLQLGERVAGLARDRGCSAAEVAVAWALAWPGVSGAIVGARRAADVDGWVGAARLELAGADLDALEQSIVATGAGSGPARP